MENKITCEVNVQTVETVDTSVGAPQLYAVGVCMPRCISIGTCRGTRYVYVYLSIRNYKRSQRIKTIQFEVVTVVGTTCMQLCYMYESVVSAYCSCIHVFYIDQCVHVVHVHVVYMLTSCKRSCMVFLETMFLE